MRLESGEAHTGPLKGTNGSRNKLAPLRMRWKVPLATQGRTLMCCVVIFLKNQSLFLTVWILNKVGVPALSSLDMFDSSFLCRQQVFCLRVLFCHNKHGKMWMQSLSFQDSWPTKVCSIQRLLNWISGPCLRSYLFLSEQTLLLTHYSCPITIFPWWGSRLPFSQL